MPTKNLPSTIIEFYDEEPRFNILSILDLRPENVIYIGPRRVKSKRFKRCIIECLKLLGIRTRCFFYSTDTGNLNAVISRLEKICESFSDIAADLTGGGEIPLAALGMSAERLNIPLFRYDKYKRSYRNVMNCRWAERLPSTGKLTVSAMLALSGAVIKEHGHVRIDDVDDELSKDIQSLWSIFRNNRKSWNRSITYFQQASKKNQSGYLCFNAPSVLYYGGSISQCDSKILKQLNIDGIIQDLDISGGKISFHFKNGLMKSCLTDIGMCLEMYIFLKLKQSKNIDDVKISVIVDWDGDLRPSVNTVNEIDILATSGTLPIFISCKSGQPTAAALNEILTLARRFGGTTALPVIVTTSDAGRCDSYFAERAKDMGIKIIDAVDIDTSDISILLTDAAKNAEQAEKFV